MGVKIGQRYRVTEDYPSSADVLEGDYVLVTEIGIDEFVGNDSVGCLWTFSNDIIESGSLVLDPPRTVPDGALSVQEGGTHYKDRKIQPIEYILANGLGYIEGNVVKYITRHKSKNGAEDIRKAIHYCQLLLESEYGEKVER